MSIVKIPTNFAQRRKNDTRKSLYAERAKNAELMLGSISNIQNI